MKKEKHHYIAAGAIIVAILAIGVMALVLMYDMKNTPEPQIIIINNTQEPAKEIVIETQEAAVAEEPIEENSPPQEEFYTIPSPPREYNFMYLNDSQTDNNDHNRYWVVNGELVKVKLYKQQLFNNSNYWFYHFDTRLLCNRLDKDCVPYDEGEKFAIASPETIVQTLNEGVVDDTVFFNNRKAIQVMYNDRLVLFDAFYGLPVKVDGVVEYRDLSVTKQ